MSKIRHTPGPWRICGQERYWVGDGDLAEEGVPHEFVAVKRADIYPALDVAYIRRPHFPEPDADDRIIADARLIAAAPDLLDALKAVSAIAECACQCHGHQDRRQWCAACQAVNKARTAIAKAEGTE